MSSKVNVRDYLSVHPENGRIYVNGKVMDKVLVDRTAEWDELKGENARLREALEFYADERNYDTDVVSQWEPVVPVFKDKGDTSRQALKGE